MKRHSRIAKLGVSRPITTLVVFVTLLVLGFISVQRIPLQLMPSGLSLPYLWVWAPYRHTSPMEIENRIVHPTEDALAPLAGLKHLNARARSDGAEFQLEFEQEQDMNETWNRVMDRLDRVRSELPDDFDRYLVFKYDLDAEPVVWAGITLPNGEDDFSHVVESRIQRMLERIDGVARVEIGGLDRTWVQVDFSRDAMSGTNTSLVEAIGSLSNDNIVLASGEVEDAGRRVLVRGLAPIDDIESLRSLPLSSGRRLGEVAEVNRVRPVRNWVNCINGKTAITLDIYKESGANTVAVGTEVSRILSEQLPRDPRLDGFGFHVLWDSGGQIRNSLDSLVTTMLWGGLLAVMVLFGFLRRVRLTIIIALAIPLSIGMAIVALYFQGHSINLISLIGLMLAVGMVVDNAIVVAGSIVLEQEAGHSPADAATRGTGLVGMAVTMATATTLVIFLPLMFLSGDSTVTFFMRHLGFPVCYALLASLWAALYGIPAASAALTKVGDTAPKPARWVTKYQARYRSYLDRALARRPLVCVLSFIFFLSFLVPHTMINKDLEGGGSVPRLNAHVSMAANMTFKEREATLLQVESWLLESLDRWPIRTFRVRLWGGSHRGKVQIFMDETVSQQRRAAAIREMKREADNFDLPGTSISFGWNPTQEARGKYITLRIDGDDTEELIRVGEDLVSRLEYVPGVIGATVESDEESRREMQVRIDNDQAGRLGVSVGLASQIIRFNLRGADMQDLFWGDEEVDLRAGFRAEQAPDLASLADLRVPIAGAASVPLTAFARLSEHKAQGETRRYDRRTALEVRADLDDDAKREEVWKRVSAVLGSYHAPDGVRIGPGQWLDADIAEKAKELQILAMSILFVFLLMGALFESLILPLSALVSIPFAIVGAYWALFLTGGEINALAAIGFPLLVGIVVNNAIVLVDRIENLRSDGMDRHTALRTASDERFRPIIMTAATTIVGLLPMAVGGAAVAGLSYAPLGRAVVGGLVVSTAMTLILVPVAYSLLDEFRELIYRIRRYAAANGRPQVEPEQ